MNTGVPARSYALERLYLDQHRDFVIDTIPALLGWVTPSTRPSQPLVFEVLVSTGERAGSERLLLSWDIGALAAQDPTLLDRARRLRQGASAQREHVVELAAYGLALVAVSVWMPGRRIVAWAKHSTPDMLLDPTPGALRGVEVAGRSRGGLASLRTALARKRAALEVMVDVAEAHVSLWCGSPRVALQVQVKP